MYALGRIPGSFFRREGRPSEGAILTCRLIDRPLRPCFVKGLRNEVQVVVTVMALNPDKMYDVVAINAASLSTQLAGLPFSGPVGGATGGPGRVLLRMRDRFLQQEVWDRMEIDVKDVLPFVIEDPGRMMFQQMLFSKIVPNCRKLGLLDAGDGWLRERFTEMGVIAFETWEDTGEEYEKLQVVEDASWRASSWQRWPAGGHLCQSWGASRR